MTLLGSDSEVWNEATFFFCPSLCHSLLFSFLLILLKLHSLHLPLPSPLFFFPHYSLFISSPLHHHFSFHFTFILPNSSSFAHLSLIPCYSVLSRLVFPLPLYSPLVPSATPLVFFMLSSSSPPLRRGALISFAETLPSPLPGQGSTTIHFTHDRVCSMPVMYIYAASGGATDG